MRDPTVRLSSEIEVAVGYAQELLEHLHPGHPWRQSEGRKRVMALIVEYLSKDPEWVRRNSRKQGPGRKPNKSRDYDIVEVIATIANDCNLRFTRHRGNGRSVSACFVVATALARLRLGISEAAVEKIWQRAKASKYDRRIPLPPRWELWELFRTEK